MGLGLFGPQVAMNAANSFAAYVIQYAQDYDASNPPVYGRALASYRAQSDQDPLMGVILGFTLRVVTWLQNEVMMWREGTAIILSGVLVLAAAGAFTQGTRGWLHRVLGWMLAVIAYKPAA